MNKLKDLVREDTTGEDPRFIVSRVHPENDDEIDRICRFRTKIFKLCEIYKGDIESDREEHDSSPRMNLMYVEERGEIRGTLWIMKSAFEEPKLPVLTHKFGYNGHKLPLADLLQQDGNYHSMLSVKLAGSQVGGLAISDKYQGTVDSIVVMALLLKKCDEIATARGINDAVICSRPNQTKYYSNFGAKVLKSEIYFDINEAAGNMPVDILYATRTDFSKTLSKLFF